MGLLKIVLAFLFIGIIYVLYSYHKYMSLDPDNKQIILDSFGKDSDGKGYSDQSHKLMSEDVQLVKYLNPEEKNIFEVYYKSFLINRRKTVLSSNQKEFLIQYTKLNKIERCMIYFFIYKADRNLNILNNPDLGDPDISIIEENLKRRYFKFISYEEIHKAINPNVSKEICLALYGELK